MNSVFKPSVLGITVSTLLLAACGDSDLPEQHLEALAAEERRQQSLAAEQAAAQTEDTLTATSAEDTAGAGNDEEPAVGAASEGEGNSTDTTEPADSLTVDAATPAETESEGVEALQVSEADSELEPTNSGATSEPLIEEEASEEAAAEPTQPIGLDLENDFSLVFADEFDASTLDFTRWRTAYEWGADLVINEELQYYVDIEQQPDFGFNPFSVDDGVLSITATPTPAALEEAANNQPWLSGVLTTANRFDMQTGYVEARMDLPEGIGLWSSFWMLSSDYNATTLRPRVFVSEFNGGNGDAIFHNYQYEDENGAVRSPGQFVAEEPDVGEGFHTFGLSWTPEELLFYVDNEPHYRVVGDQIPQQAMYLILNLAVGGVWVDAPDASTGDAPAVQIDYVRVYERNPN